MVVFAVGRMGIGVEGTAVRRTRVGQRPVVCAVLITDDVAQHGGEQIRYYLLLGHGSIFLRAIGASRRAECMPRRHIRIAGPGDGGGGASGRTRTSGVARGERRMEVAMEMLVVVVVVTVVAIVEILVRKVRRGAGVVVGINLYTDVRVGG